MQYKSYSYHMDIIQKDMFEHMNRSWVHDSIQWYIMSNSLQKMCRCYNQDYKVGNLRLIQYIHLDS